jgi:integrase
MARDQVKRNVVEVTDVPTGQPGRRSKSLTPEQVDDVLIKTAPDRLHPYFPYLVVSLLTGARTEELRALRWEHVHLDGRPNAAVGSAPFGGLAIGPRERRHEDKEVPAYGRAASACRRGFADATGSADSRSARRWPSGQESGLVFTTGLGTQLDAANVRRESRRALALVPGLNPAEWTPRELRYSFVSVLSDSGMPVEEISQLVGHRGTSVTELVYRHQLRPVIQTGATVMDRLFSLRDQRA